MANKKRPQRSPGGPAGKTPRGAAPAREPAAGRSSAEPAAKPSQSEAANYLVPGGLALALVGALFIYFRTRDGVPPEPASPAGVDAVGESGAHGGAAQPRAAQNEPSRPQQPQGSGGGNPPPSRPREVPPQGQGQHEPITNPPHPQPTSPDPLRGNFTLAQATAGLPAGRRLVADIETSMGTITCELWPDRAPRTVANFVGLARGLRDFWDPVAGRWTRRPYYDGTVFHRVIPDFMIQGGDILRSGMGGPGYEIPDENVDNHNEAGLLAMANHGPHTNGSQFFIQEDPQPRFDAPGQTHTYSVFGRCSPISLVEQIARVPTGPRNNPLTPVSINHVRIHR